MKNLKLPLSRGILDDPRWEELPYCLRDVSLTTGDVEPMFGWLNAGGTSDEEIAYTPFRVLKQDLTGVPAVVDLATMRDEVVALGGDARSVNPVRRVDLVIDHSSQVNRAGSPKAFNFNMEKEFERNGERYGFLKWSQDTFDNFYIVPPGTGICHQVNLEHLGTGVAQNSEGVYIPDSCVGTDSHTTMIGGLGVLGWGVGGIEAEAIELGQPISMLVPEVVGFKLTGSIPPGCTATDMTLKIVSMLRADGVNVVGKFVEFFGEALDDLQVEDRAMVSNMAPEYAATIGYFPVDEQTCSYLDRTGRDSSVVREYAKATNTWRTSTEPTYTSVIELDLGTLVPGMAGPKNPEDFTPLTDIKQVSEGFVGKTTDTSGKVRNGDIAIAAITSCTNTSHPGVMLMAGLVAQAANERGLTVPSYVKTSLAPGSQVVVDYLGKSGGKKELSRLGFDVVGFACTTCIGNSGDLNPEAAEAAAKGVKLSTVSSGNRNFSGRIHNDTSGNWLASPPLVVAYAIAGTTNIDLTSEPLGTDKDGRDVYLSELWPNADQVAKAMLCVSSDMFTTRYADVESGTKHWQAIEAPTGDLFPWDLDSTYIQKVPFMDGMTMDPPGAISEIVGARVLVLCPDKTTTDHISPAGKIADGSPAATYLASLGVKDRDRNTYGARRGNHNVMVRGTYANVKFQNGLAPKGKTGAYTTHQPSGDVMPMYDAAARYEEESVPVVIFAGEDCGKGSSRDWAAKGPLLLGAQAVIAKSFERIHRTNLIGMGIIPITLDQDVLLDSIELDGDCLISVSGLETLEPGGVVTITVQRGSDLVSYGGSLAIKTQDEIDQLDHGGIMPMTVRQLVQQSN